MFWDTVYKNSVMQSDVLAEMSLDKLNLASRDEDSILDLIHKQQKNIPFFRVLFYLRYAFSSITFKNQNWCLHP